MWDESRVAAERWWRTTSPRSKIISALIAIVCTIVVVAAVKSAIA